ncbi:aminotransferase class V-fold PLP-dependent enzyme [Thiospirochaeta perfilievii]|uniref:Aminotransferase class V-fold PLP-dependent enzyme n=1 Tax=Thiospirochaeta perfilievii TaxID=252967 RepID=A0A5C1QBQ8_9SPIO|nr:aminotransferase class V-fold PLP-dependent enzyme [Thiospirochaeta perfilievii]QEN04166.1 aminotransferase class V-fold PLP-dependent enzyme [Thiospirochaeta perfilievii]
MKPIKEMIKQEWLRQEIIGRNELFLTPVGKRPLVYADYTASGRGLYFIENYIQNLLRFYANSHTDDDFTGKTMTNLLHEAESNIKRIVNAGDSGKIIFSGTGATGAITRLQQILGVFWSPATKKRLDEMIDSCSLIEEEKSPCKTSLRAKINKMKPIVFVGPYEHHSNEIMWRQSLCEVVEVPLNSSGELDLDELERMVSNKTYSEREKIGSFSAASNVSGIITPIYDVARIMHKHGGIVCFDFAACAPYVEIDMNRDDKSYFDAIFISPHKFLGGPGASGLLIFNEKIYNKTLAPSIAAGGTVDFVTLESQKFTDDIESREKPGTPGILQAIKTSLVFQLKERIGIETIDKIEKYLFTEFINRFKDNKKIEFYGSIDPEKKVNIIAFNVRHGDRLVHPRLFTRIMNDFFGIQTRAGCSCAGPYGHHLLSIDKELSTNFVCLLESRQMAGLKPGWVRLNLHYSFSESEFEYICKTLEYLIEKAYLFIPLYRFDINKGDWSYRYGEEESITLNFDQVLDSGPLWKRSSPSLKLLFEESIREADRILEGVDPNPKYTIFDPEIEKVIFFNTIDG